MVSALLKLSTVLLFRKLPSRDPLDPSRSLSNPASPVVDVFDPELVIDPPSNDDSPLVDDVLAAVPAEVPEACAVAVVCAARPVALVVWAGWLNGVNWVAVAEEPA